MPRGRPLHELGENVDVEGSMLSSSQRRKRRSSKLRPGGESTPVDLIQQWSPPHKQPRVTILPKDKENQENTFVLARRSRKRSDSTAFSCWDSLPDEVILRVLRFLPMTELLKASRVCKRWHRLAFDESLWQSVDLEGVVQLDRALGQVLGAGVRRLRCPRALIGEPRFTYTGNLNIQCMDLSSCTVTPGVLHDILSRCKRLKKLSLEGLELSLDVMECLADNPGLEELNLCGCAASTTLPLIGHTLRSLSQLLKLNISWCDFSHDHVKEVVGSVAPSVTQLNISGYRQNLVLEDVKTLVERCPNLVVLDLSDSVLLTTDSFPVLRQLKHLENLGLSRCYQIHPASLAELETFPSLKWLQAYGLVQDTYLKSYLKVKRIAINTDPFSGVARPSTGFVNDRRMWSERCRLKYRP